METVIKNGCEFQLSRVGAEFLEADSTDCCSPWNMGLLVRHLVEEYHARLCYT